MVNDDNKLIEEKLKKLKILNIFLSCVFSLVGIISIMDLTMYVNSVLGINYFICLLMVYGMTNGYSYLVNGLLDKIEVKGINKIIENNKILIEKTKEDELEDRFNNLSRDSKLKLLRYINDSVIDMKQTSDSRVRQENCFDLENVDIKENAVDKEINKTLIRRK